MDLPFFVGHLVTLVRCVFGKLLSVTALNWELDEFLFSFFVQVIAQLCFGNCEATMFPSRCA